MAKPIHMMILVIDEAKSVAFYDQAFGLKVKNRFDFEGFTLVYLRSAEADFELELTFNHSQKGAYELGNGYGHVAFCVDDLDAHIARLKQANVRMRNEIEAGPGGRQILIEDPDGNPIELHEAAKG